MFKDLFRMLKVQETDLPWVQPVLSTLLHGTIILAAISAAIGALIAFVQFIIPFRSVSPFYLLLTSLGLLVFAIASGLRKRSQREPSVRLISETINLFLAVLTLYITLIVPPGFLLTGSAFVLYALPIMAAALLITPEASLIWGTIAALAILMRALGIAIAPAASVVGEVASASLEATPTVLVADIIALYLVALLGWFLGRSLQQTRQTLRYQVQQGWAGIEIGRIISASLDPSSLIQQAVHLIHNVFGYYHVGLFMLHPEGGAAVLMDAAGGAAPSLKERSSPVPLIGRTVVAVAISQKRRQVVATWEESVDSRGRPIEFTYERLPSRMELAIPLQVGEQVLGALDIHSTELIPFSEENIHTLEGLAGLIANALESTWLLNDARQRRQELEAVYAQTERRARNLEATAKLARAISSLFDRQELLNQAVDLISESLGVYHAGIFLVDDKGEWAVLTAATSSSEGGQRMLARRHKLRVGAQGIIGWVTHTGEPRIALDVGEDAVYFDNPDMPDTRSEVGLPLKVGNRIIGAVDVQSVHAAAFSDDDIAVLQILADQIAIAIENARLFQETQQALDEMEEMQRSYVAQEWGRISRQRTDLDAEYRNQGIPSLETVWPPEMKMALEKETPVILSDLSAVDWTRPELVEWDGDGNGRDDLKGASPELVEGEHTPPSLDARSALAVPIKWRDEVIGVLDLQELDEHRHWTEEDVEITIAVADQLALALENARLFEETQRRVRELSTLFDASQALTSTWLRPEEIIESVARRLIESGNTECSFSLLDADGETLRVIVDLYVEEDGTVRQEDKFEEFVRLSDYPATARVMETLQPLVVRASDPDADPAELAYMRQYGVKTLVIIPWTVKGRAIGVMELEAWEERHYTPEQLNLAVTLVNQAAVAMENARLFEEAQRRAAQLAASAEVARDATSILEDIDELLDETVHLISEQFGFYHAGLFLLDEKNEYAVLRAASSEGGKRMLARRHKLPVGKVGIVGYVAATGEPRVALDVGQDDVHFAHGDLPDTRSEMGLPLKVREQVIGVLNVQSTEKAAFSDEDVRVLQTLADQLASAIANARLFQEVRTDAMQRALINEVQQAATASLDPNELLHRAGEVISRRLERPSTIFIWDFEEGHLRSVAIHDEHGHDVPLADDLRVTRKMHPLLFSEVVDRRATTVLDARTQRLDQPTAALAEQMGIQAGIYVPLVVRGQVLGVLTIAQPEGHPLEGRDFIEIVGTNLSVALESARLYQEAVETAEQLQEMDRLKNQFLANMSHELRTPLNSIIGFSRVILKGIDGPLTDTQRIDLEAVYNSGQQLLELINGILDIAKIQAGKMELTIEDTNLNEVVKVVMSTAVALVKDKPVELQQSIPPDLPIIRADPRRVRQILINLVGNASKFTEEGFIRVEVEANPTEVIIAVADSGIGIPEDEIGTVFEEFMQVDGSSTRATGGTGLGLPITRHFVEMHGGRIWVESTVGAGSTFYVVLPIAGPPVEEEEKAAVGVEGAEERSAEKKSEPGQKTVLCVDDDEGVITLFRRYLSKQGYRIIGLTESTAVMEVAQRIQPFAITLDVMMPKKDGWQVIQELKSDPKTQDIPVIMCSIVSDKDQGISLGASGYLVKPIMEKELLAALERLDRSKDHHRVLVVDDHADDRSLLRRMIESQEGYEVIEAVSGQEAIVLVQQVRPDVIILDLMMPDVDGFAVLESVKANEATRSIPVIVVTAKTLTREERDILNRGVESLLQKGILEPEVLLADIATALGRIDATGDE